MVEFAIVLPLLALLLMMAVDFGRVFFGWVGVQNAARIGANFGAMHPDANWSNPSDPDRQDYVAQIQSDAAAINCELPDPLDVPSYPDGTDIGDPSVVNLQCDFSLISGFLAPIFGGTTITIGAEATFPVRYGPFTGPTGGVEDRLRRRRHPRAGRCRISTTSRSPTLGQPGPMLASTPGRSTPHSARTARSSYRTAS